MQTQKHKNQDDKNGVSKKTVSKPKNKSDNHFQFTSFRSESVTQRKFQDAANNYPKATQLKAFQSIANKALTDKQPLHTIQRKENKTGLPDNLKSGIEQLSGYTMDDVKVHYNSDKPAQLNAHAYAQGTDIHIASGQEKHLAHESWHVVQQKQGRVKPTTQLKDKTPINDASELELEADVMGARALQLKTTENFNRLTTSNSSSHTLIQRMVQVGKVDNDGNEKNTNIKRSVLVAAVNKGIKQQIIPSAYTRNRGGTRVLNDAGTLAITKLMEVYSKITIHLKDFMSLVHQASQDLHMLANGNENLIGIGHQHSEFTYKKNLANRDQKDVTFKSGLKKDNQRVYRTMTLNDWENSHISGHGGSIGQAMHYFNLGKAAQASNADRTPDLLVEFTFAGKDLSELVTDIQGGGEGAHSTADSLGGKTEQNTAFGIADNIFSVDLKNAFGFLSKTTVTAKVLASTNGILPDETKKGMNAAWAKRPG